MDKIKQWLKSKTVNYGLLLSLMGVAQIYFDTLQSPFITMVAGMIVVYLRSVTTKSLDDK